MEHLQILGETIRAERGKRGLSQEALADMAGISRTHVGEIERGTVNVSFSTLESTASGLGILISDLMRLYENRTK